MTARAGMWAAAGSVVAAVLASACCWLPLLLVAVGVSAAGISAGFETVRPYSLAGAAILLAAGFYLTRSRANACATDSDCAGPRPRRRQRAALWLASALVLVMAFFPSWLGFVISGQPAAGTVEHSAVEPVTLSIEGMTCEACAVSLRRELLEVRGVHDASVSYAEKAARISVDKQSPPERETLIDAVRRAGYDVRVP